jgi:hypothetical protein
MKKANGFVQKRKTPAKRMKKRGQFILIHVSGAWPVPITTDKINAHAILREHPLVYSVVIVYFAAKLKRRFE